MSDLNQLDRVLTNILEDAWDAFWKDVLVYLLATILSAVLTAASLGVLGGVSAVGFALLVHRRRSNIDAGVGTVLEGFRFMVSATLALLVIFVGTTIGFALLLIPGLFLLAAWALAFHAMAADDLGVFAALSRSYEIFKDNALLMILLLIGLAVLNAVGSAIIFGSLLTVPYSLVVLSVTYERLSGKSQVASTEVTRVPKKKADDGMTPHGVGR